MATTEGPFELLHVVGHCGVLWSLRDVAASSLEFAEGVPGKVDHFLVASGKQADIVKHFGQKAGGVSSSGETKDVDVVARLIVPHDESVAAEDVVDEGDAEHLVQGGVDPRLRLWKEAN
jgi:hypothetical protein